MPSLTKYRKMRDFAQTAEPRGASGHRARPVAGPRLGKSYVIQKHAARRLHYDFRLELDGALLSWAVPKGPSLDPSVKRLAVETEPHPLEYGGFEGTIPKGQYGGGTVMVWDRGTGSPRTTRARATRRVTSRSRCTARSCAATGTSCGRGRGRKAKRIGCSSSRETSFRRRRAMRCSPSRRDSALTGRSMDDIAAGRGGKKDSRRVWHSNRSKEEPATKSSRGEHGAHSMLRPFRARKPLRSTKAWSRSSRRSSMPRPDGDDWIHEIKFDGYRVLARIERGEVTLFTRGGNDWTERMPSLAEASREARRSGGARSTASWSC